MRTVDKLNQTLREHALNFRISNHWHSLFYFNLYRLTVAGLFLLLATRFADDWSMDVYSLRLFRWSSQIYMGLVGVSLLAMWFRHPRFTWQLAGQVVSDIALLSVISYASGGIQSNFGLLLLISLTAAGLISRGRTTLFFAALASMGMLLAHTVAVLYRDAPTAQFFQVGLLCVSYFAVAWLAHILAKYAVDSQQLAQQRGQDLVSMSEANRLVMRDMQDGVLVLDDKGMLVQMNPCAERLLRHTVRPGAEWRTVFPLLHIHYQQWKKTGVLNRETLNLDEGLQARLRIVAISRDEARGVVIFLEDMQRARAEAQQIKLAALGRLTANIAHEVRNPLTAISHATELLQEEAADVAQQRLLQIVMTNTRRINQIVQDVMQLNRRDRAQPENFELSLVLESFLEEFIQSEKLAVGICCIDVPFPCRVTFDRGHFDQVLWNLCRNALRYGSQQEGSVRLRAQCDHNQVRLWIEDDGLGVPPENQARLFEPFFTTDKEGTGLGLYIAKELCEANNARLEYVAHDDQGGACFKMIFGEQHER